MAFKKYSKKFLFEKKYIQNLTLVNNIIRVRPEKVRYPSSFMKKFFIFYWVTFLVAKSRHFFSNLDLLATSLPAS